MSIHSYSDIMTIGHKYVIDILDGPVVVEEKVDGSQFSFGLINDQLQLRSKGQDQTNATDSLFSKARAVVETLDLHPNWVYRGEYLQKPKHNALAYNRVPNQHIVIFDIEIALYDFLDPLAKAEEAARIGLECVPCYFTGLLPANMLQDYLEQWLGMESVLGGQKIEGVVIKNYNKFGPDHKVLMAKYVSDQFKEVHKKAWGEANPSQSDFVTALAVQYRTEARWNKAIMHLKERGELQEAPQDIGNLIKEVNLDILKECTDEIKEKLFQHFWKQISRGVTAGLPEWYKNVLLQNVTDPMQSFVEGELDANGNE